MAETGVVNVGGRAAWTAALDALEVSLDDAARSMMVSTNSTTGSSSSVEGSWVAPAGVGDLPAELEDRARDLLTNQNKLIGELEQARSRALQHLTVVRAVPPERDARASVYLDVTG